MPYCISKHTLINCIPEHAGKHTLINCILEHVNTHTLIYCNPVPVSPRIDF